MKQLIIAALLTIIPAIANAEGASLIDQWYTALKTSDRASFAELLSEDAKIDLNDLGISQTKAEFIEALDNWEDVASDLTLTYTAQDINATRVTAEVCYKFSAGSFTNLETFTFAEGRIINQIQEKMKDGC